MKGITIMTKRTLSTFALLVVCFMGNPALAQSVEPCDWRASAQALVEPWDSAQNTRTFANGDVRLAITDTIEPAAGAFHLMVLSPPFDEVGARQCRVVSANGSTGFAGLTLDAMSADYDPAVGLVFLVPANGYDPKTSDFTAQTLRLTLNQATGALTAQLRD